MGTSLMVVLLLIGSSHNEQWSQLADVVKPFEIADLLDRPLGLARPCTIAARSRAFVGMLRSQLASRERRPPKSLKICRSSGYCCGKSRPPRPSMELA
jgi:hypothetical protein